MRILIVHYRYFVSGGPERYLFNVKRLLEMHGDEVIPFTIAYEQNEPSPYDQYFVPPLAGKSEVYFREHTGGPRSYTRALERAFYSPVAYRQLSRLINATQPDAALVLCYLKKLSPSVIKCLADHAVPFAVRLSDFAMVCPGAHLLRDGRPCELCITGGLGHSVKHGCVGGSRAASAVNYAATRFHRFAGYFELIRQFIVPTEFTRRKMIDGGWPAERLARVPTPVRLSTGATSAKSTHPLVVYGGRLDPIKGVETVIDAVARLRRDPDCPFFAVRLAGSGTAEYTARLTARVAEMGLGNVEFEGELAADQMADLFACAWVSVVPSLGYENLPNAALESMASGTPVIASEHGSMMELVRSGVTGWSAPPGDPAAWAREIKAAVSHQADTFGRGAAARSYVAEEHSPDRHYERLMDVFSGLRRSEQLTGQRG